MLNLGMAFAATALCAPTVTGVRYKYNWNQFLKKENFSLKLHIPPPPLTGTPHCACIWMYIYN